MLDESPAIRQSLGTTPDIFRPIPLRNGDKYRALQRYRFNTEEKLWACDHIVSSCKDIESNIDDDINRFSQRYHLRTSIVAEWINQYADGSAFTGHECPVDSHGMNVILEMVSRGRQTHESDISYQSRLYDCFIVEKNRSDRGDF